MYIFIHGTCAACNSFISYNPDKVPSITIKGKREAICKSCFHRWNEIHRKSQGLEPKELHPDAYKPKKV